MAERTKSDQERAFLKAYGWRLKIVWPPFLVATMLLTLGLSGLVGYQMGWLDGGPWVDADTGDLTAPLMVYFWLGLVVLTLATVFHGVWNSVLRRQPGVFSRDELKRVLQGGQRMEATVRGMREVSIYKRGAQALRVITFELPDGRSPSFGAFGTPSLDKLEEGDVVKVLWSDEVPQLAIPVAVAPVR